MNFMKKILTILFTMLVCINANSQTFDRIRKKANSGDANSQYIVGISYANGTNGLIRDYSIAIKWLVKATNNGSGIASEYLGTLYYYGIGVTKSNSKALYYYKKAKELGVEDNDFVSSKIKDLQLRNNEPTISSIEQNKQTEENSRALDSFDPSCPPILEIIPNSFRFIDPNGNNAIDAGEHCSITFDVINKGKGIAHNCIANIKCKGDINGLNFNPISIPSIMAGKTDKIRIPITANMNVIDGKIDIIAQVTEPHGLGTDPLLLSISTKQFVAPNLEVVDYAITSTNGNKLKRKSPFDLQVLLQNLNHGNAENVTINCLVPEGVIIMNSDFESQEFSDISGGSTKSLIYQLIVTDNFKKDIIPIDIKIKEKYGKYSKDKHIELQLNQSMASNKIVVDEKLSESKMFDIQVASLTSDVDKLPVTTTAKNDNTFAVVIANETYNKEAKVPFAINDGKIFSEYCKKILGVQDENIHFVTNATLNDMKHEISWLSKVLETRKGNAKAIIYYAGHGIPDEASKNAYLLPIDGYGSDIETGYPLDLLYKELGTVPSEEVTIFLDACFSGTKREGGMLASARGIALKGNRGEPIGNTVVFSAAQGDETAYPYPKEGHGLFTYYLLKSLKDTNGNVTLKQLSDYITEKVSQQAIIINSKSQTPMVIPSKSIEYRWGNWKLK